MIDVKERPKMVERAMLVTIWSRRDDSPGEHESRGLLEELVSLVGTLGIPVIEQMLVRVPAPQPKYLVGTGKAEEILAVIKDSRIDCLIFDNALSPAQQRNWETLSGVCVIDRQEVIIDIFARRARTREARLQVELAQLEYSLPRLKRAWTHLDRQAGGIGGRGEGERQIETDRRLVRKHIDKLKAEIAHVRSTRATQRKSRERLPLPNAAIVGYTNAGKSSLLKRFTGADVLIEDKLFATLDTTTRKILLPSGQPLLLTDTVGFIRNLPHDLVDAFKATLEEAVLADFLIHVVDASHPLALEFFNTTNEVLASLGADTKRILVALNKIDRIDTPGRFEVLRHQFPGAVFVSVHERTGLPDLERAMGDMLADRIVSGSFLLPPDRHDLLALLHRHGKVFESAYRDDGIFLRATFPPKLLAILEPFRAPMGAHP